MIPPGCVRDTHNGQPLRFIHSDVMEWKRRKKVTYLEQFGANRDDIATGAVDNGVELFVLGRQLLQKLLVPSFFLVIDTAFGSEGDGFLDLLLAAAGDPDVCAGGPGILQGHQGDAAANAGDQDVLTRLEIVSTALDHHGSPSGEPREDERSGLGRRQMRGSLLELALINAHILLEHAVGVGLCPAEDLIPALLLGALEAVLPSGPGVHNDSLALPLRARVAAHRHHSPAAIRQKGNTEGGAGVQVLTDEEIPVVQRSSVDLDEDFFALRRRLRNLVQGQRVVNLSRLAIDL